MAAWADENGGGRRQVFSKGTDANPIQVRGLRVWGWGCALLPKLCAVPTVWVLGVQIAKEARKFALENGFDTMIVDTAGRQVRRLACNRSEPPSTGPEMLKSVVGAGLRGGAASARAWWRRGGDMRVSSAGFGERCSAAALMRVFGAGSH